MAHDLETLDILTDDDPKETLDWYLGVLAAAGAFLVTGGWWAPRTWFVAVTSHPGHGLNVPRGHRRRPRKRRLAA